MKLWMQFPERKMAASNSIWIQAVHHQIRVQMAHAGMPLAGDRKYGAGTNVTIGAGSLALCAASLTFFHPITGKVMKFVTNPEGAEFKGISIPQM